MANIKENLTLRAPEISDLDILYLWENDMNIWRVSNTLAPFSKYLLQKYIESAQLDIYQTKQLRLMIDYTLGKNDTRTVGAIDLFDFDPYHLRAGVGILIGSKEDRHKGYASFALQKLIDYAFKILQLHQLYCNISANNTISLKLFENAGFTICGTKKEWLKVPGGYMDEIIMQLINRIT